MVRFVVDLFSPPGKLARRAVGLHVCFASEISFFFSFFLSFLLGDQLSQDTGPIFTIFFTSMLDIGS